MKPYPLQFTPILKEKVWGGRRLERLHKPLPEAAMVGESWEIADLDATSPDGGGGAAERSVVANGEMRGLSLRDAMRAMGGNLLGSARETADGGFPLLLKFLDAREHLSVQVHPSPGYAATNPGAHLKSESWYVVDAEPGAVLYAGVEPGTDRDAFAEAIRRGTVAEHLVAIPARPGDLLHLPSGTCHALGAGVLVAEVQTPSDTTYRVFDWGREGRALHVDEALACIDFRPIDEPIRTSDGSPRCALLGTEHYAVGERTVGLPAEAPTALVCLVGEGTISSTNDAFEPICYHAGTTTLLPAAIDEIAIHFRRDTRLLEVRVGG